MRDRPISADGIRKWLNSGRSESAAVITLAEIRETPMSVVADYETPSRTSRVIFWFAGYCEFEIWTLEGQVYFRFEEEDVDSPVLRNALREFFEELAK
jgi:hypothetical protein